MDTFDGFFVLMFGVLGFLSAVMGVLCLTAGNIGGLLVALFFFSVACGAGLMVATILQRERS